jgi:hypothetical protein
MRADILLTTMDGQISAGTITLEAGTLHPKMEPGYERTVNFIMTNPVTQRDPDGRPQFPVVEIDKEKDPQAWMEALPRNYSGSMLRVALERT